MFAQIELNVLASDAFWQGRQFAGVCQRNRATLETQTQNTNAPLNYSLCIMFASFIKSLVYLPTWARQCKYLPSLVTLINPLHFMWKWEKVVCYGAHAIKCVCLCRRSWRRPQLTLRLLSCSASWKICSLESCAAQGPVSLFIQLIGFIVEKTAFPHTSAGVGSDHAWAQQGHEFLDFPTKHVVEASWRLSRKEQCQNLGLMKSFPLCFSVSYA